MSDAIKLGRIVGGKSMTMPEDVQTITTAILGNRGSGKTNTGSVIVEDLLELGAQVVIVDPTDVWWGLKSSKSGKSPGYPVVVAGGAHGDVPIAGQDGAEIANFVVENRVSVILSLRHLRKADQRRFVTDFAEQVYHRKGETENRTPLLLAIDECDAFIPQRVQGDVARMVGAIEDIVRRGRAAGLGCMLISQRAASVNKDVLTQVEAIIAHRHTSPQDRNALKAWVEGHDSQGHGKVFLETLAELKQGEAWVWSPEWLDVFEKVKVRERRTFDSSATPKQGKVAKPTAQAEIDLDALTAQLKQSVETARANDPKELKKRIAELERDAANQKPVVDTYAIDKAVCEALKQRDRQWQDCVDKWYAEVEKQRREQAEQIIRTPAPSFGTPDNTVVVKQARKVVTDAPKTSSRASVGTIDTTAIEPVKSGALESRILDALAWWEAVGIKHPSRTQVAFVAGSKVGGHFNNTVSKLRTSGLVDYPEGGSVCLTDSGRAQATVTDAPRNFDGLCAMVRGVIDGGLPTLIFNTLVEHGEMSKDELSELLDRRGGHFNNTVSRLRSLGVVDYPSKGRVDLSSMFVGLP
ncbi:MAG: helicase HerA-like domain-containing protein [Phycisphaerales bacterium]